MFFLNVLLLHFLFWFHVFSSQQKRAVTRSATTHPRITALMLLVIGWDLGPQGWSYQRPQMLYFCFLFHGIFPAANCPFVLPFKIMSFVLSFGVPRKR